jgi:GTP pyrophosphokinase
MNQTMDIWPYIELARHLLKKQRRGIGNMFRHQVETFSILLEFGHESPVLLKASLIHDLFEDGHKIGFTDFERIRTTDKDGRAVYDLVKEMSIRVENGVEEPKPVFLKRIMESGSNQARLLKLADRLSNINGLFATNDNLFIKKYIDETRDYIMPHAYEIDERIAGELENNIKKLESMYYK